MEWLTRRIFLVDALGAVASTAATGFGLPAVHTWIGLPREVLIALAGPAALLAAYSFSRWLVDAPLTPWLPLLAYLNLTYCSVVVLTVAWFANQITVWGGAYFAGEMVIIIGLVVMQSRIVRSTRTGSE